eukprot:CAMPEP_0198139288 /NCGR_PEP_ID=MMETSP1443-20131203/2632_1 /TAXON_ID=186043 /ORGANISM="Entomoneis sp., Strain CCMP2396" /LENGTH=173 /DNA_ID=CAMNT_0043801379 /DNA_START=23 /DNA_END=541 /DNA_ORIENTATION=+
MPRRAVSTPTRPRRHFGRRGLLVIVGITCVTILVAAKFQTDLHSIPSKTDQELQETVNRDELEQVFVSPRIGGEISDMGGVPSICKSWDENEAQGKQIAGILFNHSDWMCMAGSVGNKLGLYFHARAFASLHGVSFRITPNCHKAVDSLTAWLPQTIIPAQTNEIAAANNTSV